MIALKRILQTRVVAILRVEPSELLPEACEALVAGGVDTIEVPVTVPGAIEAIAEAKRRLGDAVCLGAGTVLDEPTLHAVRDAGGEYVVSPTVDVSLIEAASRHATPMLAGALSPTEILTAWQAGCPLIKVFPGDAFGMRYLKDLAGPLPQIRLLPTGGVTAENVRAFLDHGAAAVGIGSALVSKPLLEARDFGAIQQRAEAFVAAVNQTSPPQ